MNEEEKNKMIASITAIETSMAIHLESHDKNETSNRAWFIAIVSGLATMLVFVVGFAIGYGKLSNQVDNNITTIQELKQSKASVTSMELKFNIIVEKLENLKHEQDYIYNK